MTPRDTCSSLSSPQGLPSLHFWHCPLVSPLALTLASGTGYQFHLHNPYFILFSFVPTRAVLPSLRSSLNPAPSSHHRKDIPDAASFIFFDFSLRALQRRLDLLRSVPIIPTYELNDPPPWVVSETGPKATRRDPLIIEHARRPQVNLQGTRPPLCHAPPRSHRVVISQSLA